MYAVGMATYDWTVYMRRRQSPGTPYLTLLTSLQQTNDNWAWTIQQVMYGLLANLGIEPCKLYKPEILNHHIGK